MSRSRVHRLLQLDLAAGAGVPVEVRWETSLLSAGCLARWAWHVFWSDGPTPAAMLAWAASAATDLPGVDAEDLIYDRALSPHAYALAMIRHLRQGSPPLGDHHGVTALTAWLQAESHPERGDVEDVELATRLVRLTDGALPAMIALLDRHGLAALTGDLSTGNVTPLLRRHR